MKLSEKDLFEIEHWRRYKAGVFIPEINRGSLYYKRYLEVWGIGTENLGKVMDAGCGPELGCLPYITADLKVALDPLIYYYKETGLLNNSNGVKLVNKPIEKYYTHKPIYNTIICANAIDHGDSDFRSLKNISDALVVGGKLYLHVHLRKDNEINVAHDHPLKLEDFLENCKKYKLKPDYKVYNYDPVELGVTYDTLIAVCTKTL